MRLQRLAALALALAMLAGCVTRGRPDSDPYEPVNRAAFHFNKGLDRFVLQPVANAWAVCTPHGFRMGLDRFFENLKFPVYLVSHLGQAEWRESGKDIARFTVNTAGGFFGFYHPAGSIGLEAPDEGLGKMFARWGVPSGPYWVLPFFGPSNPRDGAGSLLEAVLNPVSWVSPMLGTGTLATSINRRAIDVRPYRSIEVGDEYVRMRSRHLEDAAEDTMGRTGDSPAAEAPVAPTQS
jgi:phospholipid-binding lipoprotein MlaA